MLVMTGGMPESAIGYYLTDGGQHGGARCYGDDYGYDDDDDDGYDDDGEYDDDGGGYDDGLDDNEYSYFDINEED